MLFCRSKRPFYFAILAVERLNSPIQLQGNNHSKLVWRVTKCCFLGSRLPAFWTRKGRKQVPGPLRRSLLAYWCRPAAGIVPRSQRFDSMSAALRGNFGFRTEKNEGQTLRTRTFGGASVSQLRLGLKRRDTPLRDYLTRAELEVFETPTFARNYKGSKNRALEKHIVELGLQHDFDKNTDWYPDVEPQQDDLPSSSHDDSDSSQPPTTPPTPLADIGLASRMVPPLGLGAQLTAQLLGGEAVLDVLIDALAHEHKSSPDSRPDAGGPTSLSKRKFVAPDGPSPNKRFKTGND